MIKYCMKKILITGGLGLIGHNVIPRLVSKGHTVVSMDIKTDYGIIPKTELDYLITERQKKIPDSVPNFEYDICDREAVDELFKTFKFDTVLHLASFPRQKVVNADPAWGSRVMSEGMINLLEAAAKYNVKKFVYTSSSMVYGDFQDNTTEDFPCNPLGQYGIMKLAGEWLLKDYSRRTGMAYTIIRPSAVYGPLDVEDRVISKFVTTAIRGGTLKVKGVNELLDFTYVDDAADGIAAAVDLDIANNKTYNITKGASHTLLQAAELAIKLAGKGELQLEPKDQDFPSRAALNIDRAKTDLGFDPKVDIEQGFVKYYEWLNVYLKENT
jgi:nucleoside-diphosphate-sugar epimerase